MPDQRNTTKVFETSFINKFIIGVRCELEIMLQVQDVAQSKRSTKRPFIGKKGNK